MVPVRVRDKLHRTRDQALTELNSLAKRDFIPKTVSDTCRRGFLNYSLGRCAKISEKDSANPVCGSDNSICGTFS